MAAAATRSVLRSPALRRGAATSSALFTSRRGYGWLSEGGLAVTRREEVGAPQINPNCNPHSHPSINLPHIRQVRRYGQPTRTTNGRDWYNKHVVNAKSYITAAFRSSRENEAYLFSRNEYLLVNYPSGSTNDKVIHGPVLIIEDFPSLAGTEFGEYGPTCAFASHNKDEAFIFFPNICALINYTPGTTNDFIIERTTIDRMFPFFKGTVFERGVDAAFESTKSFEAYLFKGNQYALINYGEFTSKLIAIRNIKDGFPSLKNTIFESGIDAAFASHRTDEAYLFKGDSYALINFAPGTTNDYIIGGVKEIWPSLRPILPRKTRYTDGSPIVEFPEFPST